MTICKVLARGKNGENDIIAYEKYDKYSSFPYYEIVVSHCEIATLCEKTARTTWKKRFSQFIEKGSESNEIC